MDFDQAINSAEVYSRDQVSRLYDPLKETAVYMKKLVDSQREWDSTIKKAREELLGVNPRDLYFEFIIDISNRIEQNTVHSERFAKLLRQVTIRGFGMTKKHINIKSPPRGSSQWSVILNKEYIKQHLNDHIVGEYFLNIIETNDDLLNNANFSIASSDVSQHRNSVPSPARFFSRNVPFLLNNAAGSVLHVKDGQASFDQGRFNPLDTNDILKWMLIDPSYQDELEPEDFIRCTASAMDVGQYLFEHEFLLNNGRDRFDLILRDGSLFPQDAYLDNYLIDNRRGEFTRKAIIELLKCLNASENSRRLYCGVSKNVRLKLYSAVLDWYIEQNIDANWTVGGCSLTDGQAMTILLSSPDFAKEQLKSAISTCLIRRSFTTRANLNEKAPDINDLESYFENYENKIRETNQNIDISQYRALCKKFHTYIVFIGHAPNPSKLLPRYEFFDDCLSSPEEKLSKILTAIKYSSFDVDQDHSFGSDEQITYLIPTVTQQAHRFSKDVGQTLSAHIKNQLWNQYLNFVQNMD
ncbi:hypothetical protein IQ219_10915 [Synechocystis sp. LEGE 06083]|nr:hypothetical protein [Synechocystis sp. LEGE 06083]